MFIIPEQKSLCNNVHTTENLQTWAKKDRLVHTGHFLWAAGGNKLLKSQEGLLRSLIYQVLCKCPDMIKFAYPKTWGLFFPEEASDACGTMSSVTSSATISLSVDGLLDTLTVLCSSAVESGIRFCFFIDGLDEYEGSPDVMVELARVLRSLPNLKVCVSSRDWNNFEAEFCESKSQKLYMQDFNRKDIERYVHDTLDNNPYYQEMEDRDTAGK